ncbi:MAG: DnaK suppressor protein [Actinomycetota bacterium]|nr:DnaK suppressor protein [Actinomycetota bacterium]
MPDPARVLAEERLRVLAQVDDLTAEFNEVVRSVETESPDDEHDPDGSTTGFERQRVAALLDHVRRRLAELDDAIERIEAGTYGACATCGRPIAPERLEALPTTATCVDCASA